MRETKLTNTLTKQAVNSNKMNSEQNRQKKSDYNITLLIRYDEIAAGKQTCILVGRQEIV